VQVQGRYFYQAAKLALRNAVFALIEPDSAAEHGLQTHAMKRPLDEATALFRENEARAGEDREKANLYHGLSLLAEGLRRLEKELAELQSGRHNGAPTVSQRRRMRPLVRAVAVPVH
jgi:hypothetical protein